MADDPRPAESQPASDQKPTGDPVPWPLVRIVHNAASARWVRRRI
ncbi:hypothetical protein [Micromonospora sp. NBC_01796]|nr:hypothetical protein [Micromonospora sp. NBC_01796]WSA88610.1 hypothetical protein OIE47_13945 [Micromonospora sp. NBC_01796]